MVLDGWIDSGGSIRQRMERRVDRGSIPKTGWVVGDDGF
jgi:hypothetical protein